MYNKKMTYEENIKSMLADSSQWPNYSKPDVMGRLDEMADDALSVDNIDERSCIASILILQQLTEELIKVLLKSCNFLVQVSLLPLEIYLKDHRSKMFGRVLEDLKATITFPEKDELIGLANKINKERIDIAHGLIEKASFKNLPKTAMQVRDDFEEFFKLYSSAHDWTRLCLKDLKKDLLDE